MPLIGRNETGRPQNPIQRGNPGTAQSAGQCPEHEFKERIRQSVPMSAAPPDFDDLEPEFSCDFLARVAAGRRT
jgi:hypothetical protein